MEIEMIVEIAQGSRNKYEMDHETGAIWLDRTLFTATQYPLDYGFFPHTLGEDGDPLDALILLPQPTFPGCHMWARPIGVFWMTDEKGPDAKVLCVPSRDARYAHYRDLSDAPDFLLAEIANFFEVYKLIEPDKSTEVGGWNGVAEAEKEIAAAIARYVP
ncbi:MAG: inorganic diphosphatase [Ilumatobacteraceae bacterium]|jgi:inorganic pyrophosphatase|nr:inorganic diphosphatase [Ilumatobacteraceae bacterium]MDP4702712.1 inorganic diphosphatase [Ilumatobacteraceae bacterium]MDP5108787.1 inorganic diphosphatase [Ilumatobacteraceae bacterium]